MSEDQPPKSLESTYLRLRGDVSIEALAVDDSFWPRLMRGDLGNFHNEYLVTVHESIADWKHWEMHPMGDEIVCLLAGEALMILDLAAGEQRTRLVSAGQFVLVPKGTWHTAKISAPCRMLFITAGEGTQHRPLA